MHTYTFEVVVKPDEERWHAYCPALQENVQVFADTRVAVAV